MSTQQHQPQTYEDPSDFADEQPLQNPLLVVHRALRGRYLYAIIIAVVLAAPGAILAYKFIPVTYSSVGLVEVQQELESLLYRIPENERLQDVSGYAFTQAEYLRSRRVINLAATSEDLRNAGWPTGDEGVRDIIGALEVVPSRRSRTIRVQATHQNPALSQQCVNAVLDAYVEIHGANVGLSVSDKQRELTNLIQSLDRELQATRDTAFRLADEFGADTLTRRHMSQLDELDRYDALIAQHEGALIIAQAQESQLAEDIEPQEPDIPLLATQDDQLAQLMQARDEMLAEKKSLSERFGENHRSMQQLESNLQSLETQIDSRVQLLAAIKNSIEDNSDQADTLDVDTIQARLVEFLSTRVRMREEVRELGRRIRQIEGLDEQSKDTRAKLDDATNRLSQLDIEMRNNRTERVFIAQRGDFPLTPTSDKRIPAAAAAAFAGSGLAFGVVFLFGFMKPTYRYIDEIEKDVHSLKLLGTLPDYTSNEQAQRDLAAHSIHHIRNTLQFHATKHNLKVITVTSAAASDGKTSLVLAIGTSFASAGQRVLLMDCDLVGCGLSRALNMQQEEGFAQLLSDDGAPRLVQQTGVANLDALPAGRVDHLDHTRLSPDRVRPVLDALKSQYDLVLIDTGPLLGSLEAGIVCSLSDSVILAISRGQSMKLIDAASEKLKRMHANCAGVVFNRAAPSDFRQSVSRASVHSQSYTSRADQMRHSEPTDARAALMDAVAGTATLEERESSH